MKKRLLFLRVLAVCVAVLLLFVGCQKPTPPPTEEESPSTEPLSFGVWEECYTYEGDCITGITDKAPYHFMKHNMEVVIPSVINGQQIKTVGESVLDYLGFYVTKVTLGEGITTIAEGAFDDNENLAEIHFPQSLQSIGDRAFETQAMFSLTIPAGVTHIAEFAFGISTLVQITNLSQVDLSRYLQVPTLEIRTSLDTSFSNTLVYHEDGNITYRVGDEVYWMGYQGDSTKLDLTGKGVTKFHAFAQISIHSNVLEMIVPEGVAQGAKSTTQWYDVAQMTNLSGIKTGFSALETRDSLDTPFSSVLTYHEDGNITLADGDDLYWCGYYGTETELDLFNMGITGVYKMFFGYSSPVQKVILPSGMTEFGGEFLFPELTELVIPASAKKVNMDNGYDSLPLLDKVIFENTENWLRNDPVIFGKILPVDVSDPFANARAIKENEWRRIYQSEEKVK